MTRCLDEATLQCYFDGELSPKLMEGATAHLAACATCSAAARELAEEMALLTSALEAEFDLNVPTAALRERIDAAVLGERIANAGRSEKAGLFASLASVFSSQRGFGYASLVAVLAFATIFGIVKFRQPEDQAPTTDFVASAPPSVKDPAPSPDNSSQTPRVSEDQPVVPASAPVRVPVKNVRHSKPKVSTTTTTTPVELIPGERSYLQTIARLDTTIKQNKGAMRPSLQVEYERNLAVVDRAIAATRNAAKSNPNDPDAADFMFAAYQSKVDFLNTIADARLSGGRSH